MKILLGQIFNFDRDKDYALMIDELVMKFNVSKDDPFPYIDITLDQLINLKKIIEKEIRNEEANI